LKKLIERGLSIKDYGILTCDLLKQIDMIQEIIKNRQDEVELIWDYEPVDFKFKKLGMKKLLLFDLDETLIHVERIDDPTYQSLVKGPQNNAPKVEIKVMEPETNTEIVVSFYIRPFTMQCLKQAN